MLPRTAVSPRRKTASRLVRTITTGPEDARYVRAPPEL
jgi:hypothetical protein